MDPVKIYLISLMVSLIMIKVSNAVYSASINPLDRLLILDGREGADTSSYVITVLYILLKITFLFAAIYSAIMAIVVY